MNNLRKKIIIVGSGIHGTSIFLNFPKSLQLETLVIDRNKSSLSEFICRAKKINMHYLRSPLSHSLIDPPSALLFDFAIKNYSQYSEKKIIETHFKGKYFTPSLEIFEKFIQKKCNETLYSQYIHDEIIDIYPHDNHWTLKGSSNTYFAEYVILALGNDEPKMPYPPPFESFAQAHHIFSSDFSFPKKESRVAVIGAGMTGVQLAINLINEKYKQVNLISNKKLSVRYFDSEIGYIGNKLRPQFLNADTNERHELIENARFRGTINYYIFNEYQNILNTTGFNHIEEAVINCKILSDKSISLRFSKHNEIIVDTVILATGLGNSAEIVASHPLLKNLVNKHNAPLSDAKTPLLTANSAQWLPKLFISGQIAELGIGPFAGNIIGAQMFSRIYKNFFARL